MFTQTFFTTNVFAEKLIKDFHLNSTIVRDFFSQLNRTEEECLKIYQRFALLFKSAHLLNLHHSYLQD